MDASRKIPGSIHDEKLIIQFYRLCPVNWVHISREGTPNPVLEAMACGVPVISTDVGVVPEVFGPEQMQYVMEERSVVCLKEKIEQLLNTENVFQQLSQENVRSIEPWDWQYMAENLRKYFRDCLSLK